MKSKLLIAGLFVLAMSLFLWVARAQQAYQPNDAQTLQLRLKALDVQKAQPKA